jgi:hypothetical protein
MKEQYETQKEQNDTQIEILENLHSDEAITKEAVSLIASWQTTDDMILWMTQNSTEYETWSDSKYQQMVESWEKEFLAKQAADEIL